MDSFEEEIARPFGMTPRGSGGGASIAGYGISTGLLFGTAPPGLLVVVSVNNAYAGAVIASASGAWSLNVGTAAARRTARAKAFEVGDFVLGGTGFIGFSTTYTTVGSQSVAIPAGASQVVIQGYGAGGGSGTLNGATVGGNGGSYAKATLSLPGLTALYLTIPAGAIGAAGSPATVQSNGSGGPTVMSAAGGNRNAVANAASVGDLVYAGGLGSGNGQGAGYGGGAAGPNGPGGNASGSGLGTGNGGLAGNGGGSAANGSNYGGGSGQAAQGGQGAIVLTWN